jgi:TATA-box binding protein (TBP) (component of TFIID and TFIIIB)
LHFAIHKPFLSTFQERLESYSHKQQVKKYSNYIVLSKSNNCPFTYIIFPINGYINVTGLKNYTNIIESVKFICDNFHLSRHHCGNITIDNLTISGFIGFEISLSEIFYHFCEYYYTRYNINIYPGLQIRFPKLGTIIIFSSGKYTIVGAKCLDNAKIIIQKLQPIAQQYAIQIQ